MKYRIFLFLMIFLVLASHLLISFNATGASVRMWRIELQTFHGFSSNDIEGVSLIQDYASTSLIGPLLAVLGQLALLISFFIFRLPLQQKWVKIALPFLWISVLVVGIGFNLLELVFHSLLFFLLSIVLYILARQKRA